MKFKTMKEAVEWAYKNQKPIPEYDCPKFDMEHPIEKDLRECDTICENHWACHTWRHLRGSRDKPLENERVVIQFT